MSSLPRVWNIIFKSENEFWLGTNFTRIIINPNLFKYLPYKEFTGKAKSDKSSKYILHRLMQINTTTLLDFDGSKNPSYPR